MCRPASQRVKLRNFNTCAGLTIPHVVQGRTWEMDAGTAWQKFMTGPQYTRVVQDLHKCASSGLRAFFLLQHLP